MRRLRVTGKEYNLYQVNTYLPLLTLKNKAPAMWPAE